jgi:3-deoxy-D-manno-octulosonate 8-phosphate phosphatase (KDO 8-P phosphatase)
VDFLLENIDVFVFDFDGVITNNKVHLDQNGNEFVTCSRADGLAFAALRKLDKAIYILSTEKNLVVSARAKKLKIPVIQGINNKYIEIQKLAKKENYDLNRAIYIGNDLNDYRAMELCGYSACPSDSHVSIKEISTFMLESKGGEGVVRELLENFMRLDILNLLYPKEKL